MDFDNTQNPNNSDQSPTTPQPQTPPTVNIPDFSSAVYDPFPKKKKGSGWKIFFGIVLVLSILANGIMFLSLIVMGVAFSGGSASANDNLVEKVLIDGPRTSKIAVISIEGVINGEVSEWVKTQIDVAQDDDNVKALIVRIVSPGGTVSSSDQIHHYISRFKESTNKPVLAFMQSIATSGGYYSAVACDQIIAEPTVITGSIGVIMNHLTIQELLEEKLGINPVTIKSGPRKDWPSMFNETTDEQKKYLQDKVITPAYERFVDLVYQGRKDSLSAEKIRELADGSIYTATEAVEEKLIDAVGYFNDAVYMAKQMAQISDARIVSYEELFSFWSIMGAQSKSKIDLDTMLLEKLAAPQLLYLWDGKK